MADFVLSQPAMPAKIAVQFVFDHFAKTVTLSQLDSERDQNFLAVENVTGDKYVLKIANLQTSNAILDLENQVMLRLSKQIGHQTIPVPIPDRFGKSTALLDHDGNAYSVRLVSFIPGQIFAETRPHSDGLLFDLGSFLGRMTTALSGFDHQASHREFHWDLDCAAETISEKAGLVSGELDFRPFLDRYSLRVKPRRDALRKSVIHNDANDHNVLVDTTWPQRVAGIIDFGDIVYSSTVNELAICIAYVMLEKSDPLWAAAQVIRGFDSEFKLTDDELAVLFDLACMRLCTSVVMAAHQRSLQPENEYLSVTDLPAQALLKTLGGIDPDFAESFFRNACKRSLKTGSVIDRLEVHVGTAFPILGKQLTCNNVKVIDFSVSSSNCLTDDISEFEPADRLKTGETAESVFGVGRYCEPRICYQGEQFLQPNMQDEARSIHIGMDLFAPVGAPLFAPFDAVIHSFADNEKPFDYGPTIILKHCIDEVSFFTLYGHLSRESLSNCESGKAIAAGEQFATFGDSSVNGGWAPHVHFQIMTEMFDKHGDFPGVAVPRDLDFGKQFVPTQT